MNAPRSPRRPLLAILYLSFLLVFALLPEPWKGLLALKGPLHFCFHTLAFFVAFWLLGGRAASWPQALLVAVALLALGIGLELAQTLIYRNPFEYKDVTADALGCALGWVLWAVGRRGAEDS